MSSEHLVAMRQIDKSFGSVSVLEHVDFDLQAGEIHALMGENGAGKSTLMKILTGIYQADHGEISLNGIKQIIKSPQDAKKLGVRINRVVYSLFDKSNFVVSRRGLSYLMICEV